MVGPSLSEEDRIRGNARLKAGFVALVAVSAGLMAIQLDPTPAQLIGAVLAGAVVGTALLWYVMRNLRGMRP